MGFTGQRRGLRQSKQRRGGVRHREDETCWSSSTIYHAYVTAQPMKTHKQPSNLTKKIQQTGLAEVILGFCRLRESAVCRLRESVPRQIWPARSRSTMRTPGASTRSCPLRIIKHQCLLFLVPKPDCLWSFSQVITAPKGSSNLGKARMMKAFLPRGYCAKRGASNAVMFGLESAWSKETTFDQHISTLELHFS